MLHYTSLMVAIFPLIRYVTLQFTFNGRDISYSYVTLPNVLNSFYVCYGRNDTSNRLSGFQKI